MRKQKSRKHGLLPYPVIAAAANGDPDAINVVLEHFAGYIRALSSKRLYDEDGFPCGSINIHATPVPCRCCHSNAGIKREKRNLQITGDEIVEMPREGEKLAASRQV